MPARSHTHHELNVSQMTLECQMSEKLFLACSSKRRPHKNKLILINSIFMSKTIKNKIQKDEKATKFNDLRKSVHKNMYFKG